jgi:MipA family protein
MKLVTVLRVLPLRFAVLCFAALSCTSISAQATHDKVEILKPTWELGAGIGAAYLPDYRGSDQSQGLVIPTPYFVYRSPSLALEGNEIRMRLFGSERLTLDSSFDFSLGSTLKENRARANMPKLPATLSIGPQISYLLWNSDGDWNRLNLRMPLRQAIAVNGSQRNAGLVFEPHLNADLRHISWLPGWDVNLEIGPNWGNRPRHQLYYDVANQYATANRPAYNASAGYGGAQASISMARRWGQWYAGAYVRYDTIRGASFESSPLIRRKDNLTFATGFTYVFSESKERVAVLR